MGLSASIISFLREKFWRPIVDESVYYNPFNTAVYAALFGLAAAYLGKPLLQRYEVELNRDFFTAIAPFVFLGGALRSMKDADIVNTILLETPFIYMVVASILIATLVGSRKLDSAFDIEYHKTSGIIGSTLLVTVLLALSFSKLHLLAITLGLFAFLSWGTYLIAGLSNKGIADLWFALPIAGHWFDASSSFIALRNGAEEKHILAQFFIDLFGPVGMFGLKAIIVIPVVYYIHQNIEGFDKKYYLFLIALLGFALGTRNIISLLTV